MEVINVGRSSSNDEVIEDSTVSRTHCQFVKDDRGNICVIDTNSKNGVYVNGKKIYGKEYLSSSDVVRIGNTTLPWKNYFPPIIEDQVIGDPVPDLIPQEGNKTGLGTIALITSIVGAALLIVCAIRIMKYGIFAWMGSASTLIFVSGGLSIIALILGAIADYNDYKDADTGEIGKTIAWSCIGLIVGFFIYVRFINPDALNPFKDLMK